MNFLSKLKNKKTVFFVFLFLILAGFIYPHSVKALTLNPVCWGYDPAGADPTSFRYLYCHYSGKNYEAVADAFGGPVKEIFNGVLMAIGVAMVSTTAALASLAAGLLDWVITDGANGASGLSYTGFDNPVIQFGWPMVRNLANMIVVLGFVVIGIATSIRWRDYEAKKLLAPLIIAALLINFSLLICGIIIDGSNITTTYFFKSSGFLQKTLAQAVADQSGAIIAQYQKDSSNISALLAPIAGYVFYNIMFFIISILYFFLFLFRYMALWILVVLSPLAFVFYVFPSTKKFFTMWWSNFLGWCIIGIPASFFLWLSDNLTKSFVNPVPGQTSIAAFLVPGMFLLIGFIFTMQIGTMGASAAIGLATGAMGYAAGASKGVGKFAADKTGVTGAANSVKDWGTQRLENAGLLKAGTTSKNRQSRLNTSERSGRIGAMSDEEAVQELLTNRRGQGARLDRAQIVKTLASRGKLNLIPQNRRQQLINEAITSGVAAKDIITGMESGDIANIMNNPNAYRQFTAEARAEGFKTLRKRGDLDLINAGQRNARLVEARQHGERIEEVEKSAYRYGGDNEERVQRIMRNRGVPLAQAQELARQEVLDQYMPNMSHEQLQDIDPIHLTYNAADPTSHRRLDRLKPEQIRAFENAAPEVRQAVRSHIGQFAREAVIARRAYRAALAVPDQAAAKTHLDELRRLNRLIAAIQNVQP